MNCQRIEQRISCELRCTKLSSSPSLETHAESLNKQHVRLKSHTEFIVPALRGREKRDEDECITTSYNILKRRRDLRNANLSTKEGTSGHLGDEKGQMRWGVGWIWGEYAWNN